MRRFTQEEIKRLSTYEEHFTSAVKAKWSRYPGRAALLDIHATYCAATGDTRRFPENCGGCILHLLQDCGVKYFAEKDVPASKKKTPKKK